MKKETYNISGMSCAACSASVMKVVSRLEGVESCDVNLITEKMTVVYNPKKTGENDFIRVVEKAGFGISRNIPEKSQEKTEKEKTESPLPIIISAIFSAVLLYISMGQMIFPNLPIPNIINIKTNPYNFAITQFLLCLPALYFGRKFFLKGIPLLFRGHPNMDSLVAVGAGASLIYSLVTTYGLGSNPHGVHNLYFESVAVVITLIMLGKFFEGRSRKKTADAIKKLLELSPDTATVLRDGKEITLATKDVAVGETVLVKTGAKIPLDGVVLSGESHCDESMLTGESIPVRKVEGERVTGGSLNINGLLQIEVTKTAENTTLAKIVEFVEEAQSKKAPISKVADKVAGIFVPAVIVVAVVSLVIWLIFGKELAFALKIFTSVLVVACPCALGLATPTAVMVGTGLGAQNGILIRNGEVLETTHKIKAAVFDKTGTLTEGEMTVTDVFADNEDEIINLTAIAEKGSEHPLAKAIIKYAEERDSVFETVPESFENVSGFGVKCSVLGKELIVGKAEFLEEKGIDISPFKASAEKTAAEGKSLIFTAADGKALGFIALADRLKPTSKSAIENLQNMGIKTILLSGDNRLCAEYIGEQIGVDEIYSEVLPREKAKIVTEIRKKYGEVMMIGDGINDAPALSEADVGCAVGTGSDIAIDTADIILMKNDVLDVAKAINLSKLTLKNIKQNLFWAFCYNTICIPVAAGLLYAFGGPLFSPMLAGFAMSLSSVFVVGNALRLRNKKI